MAKPVESQRRALGRGLSSLLPTRGADPGPPTSLPSAPTAGSALLAPIDSIDPNPTQPRSVFQPERLSELADSIRSNGIIQPLIVRRHGDRYQLIAGERRWRAARLAGLDRVPIIVHSLVDNRTLEISLIENIQREDLNPIEIAHAFDRLAREHHLSHEEIARRTGKDRTTVTNTIRLLRLPETVQVLLAERRLSMGHARALLGLQSIEQQQSLAEKIAAQGLSVRQVERTVSRMNEARESDPDPEEQRLDPNVKAAIDDLERRLGTRVRIVEKSAQRGRIEIEYYSLEDLDRIYGLLVGDGAGN
jgi:ParB family transcriptional regulator, chromosome partitioning protein